MRKMLIRGLKYFGQHCFEAANGLVAFGLVKESLVVHVASETTAVPPHFDAVCMDNNMYVHSSSFASASSS